MKMPQPKPAGTWDFYGALAPTEFPDGTYSHVRPITFSLGCFQWEPMKRFKGTKRGKTQHRINGSSRDPKPAFDAARAYCAEKNAQEKG